MKSRVILLTVVLTLAQTLTHGQEWIGNLWTLDTTLALHQESQGLDFSHLRYQVCNGTLYYVEATAYQQAARTGYAQVHTFSLYDYEQKTLAFPIPKALQKEHILRNFWVNDLDCKNGKSVISVQNWILVYRINDDIIQFDTIFEHPNVKVTYLHNNDLYYLEEDHDNGYTWFRRADITGKEETIGQLHYEAPHVVQVSPNRYLFRDDHHLYFLSTREASMQRYTLDGKSSEQIRFDIPNWRPFETEYIEKTLSVPYGIERIHATMADIHSYSYPKIVFPIGDDHMLYLSHYDTTKGKSTLQYVVMSSDGRLQHYRCTDTSDRAYIGGRFPFNLLRASEDCARTTWNDLLLEITPDGDVDWSGQTPVEYKQALERFYKHHEPIYKIRIMRYKNTHDAAIRPFFLDDERGYHALRNLPSGKSILLVNNTLECSACRNNLLRLLNDVDVHKAHIGILQSYIPGALQEREIRKSIQQFVKRDYDLYYLATGKYSDYPTEVIGQECTFPALLFYETGRAPVLFTSDQIFEDDIMTYRYRDTFEKFMKTFLAR